MNSINSNNVIQISVKVIESLHREFMDECRLEGYTKDEAYNNLIKIYLEKRKSDAVD